MTDLCRVKGTAYPRHDWTILGVCKRCGERLPNIITHSSVKDAMPRATATKPSRNASACIAHPINQPKP